LLILNDDIEPSIRRGVVKIPVFRFVPLLFLGTDIAFAGSGAAPQQPGMTGKSLRIIRNRVKAGNQNPITPPVSPD
jgi:hypothetical protein